MSAGVLGVTALATATLGAVAPVGAAVPAKAASPKPAFAAGPCPEGVPASDRISCGTLTIPENRTKPGGAQVQLAVATIAAPQPVVGATPLLRISGGPGDPDLTVAGDFLDDPRVLDRDVVLVDLRGTGASTPSLACPEVDVVDTLGAPSEDRAARRANLDAVAACRDRLDGEGVNRRVYDYTEMSADLADLRVALGIPKWDVYGISNGGRLALELVRRHPQGIRSLVLDASLPPQGNYFGEQWPHAARAFEELFAECSANAACAAAHPDLANRFARLVESLATDPVTVTVTNTDTGAPGTVVFDDRHTLEFLRSGLYDTGLLPAIPALIDGLANGGAFELVAGEVLRRGPEPGFAFGQSLSDNCREEVAFLKPATTAAQAKQFPALARVIGDDTFRAECRVWNVGKAAASVDRPVRSRIPTLLTVGTLDPVHPRAVERGDREVPPEQHHRRGPRHRPRRRVRRRMPDRDRARLPHRPDRRARHGLRPVDATPGLHLTPSPPGF